MPRTINAVAHTVRREAFVDAAQRLIQAKGYEQMSIQDVLDELDVSRGAFYHYFASKAALLAAVVERMVVVATAELEPSLADPGLPAVEKFARLFSGVARWKLARKDLVLALMPVWFSDDNAIVREKLRQAMVMRLTPLLAAIIRQGQAEGAFSVNSPDATARVFVSLWQGAGDVASELFVARQAGTVTLEVVERALNAYVEAFERVLGAPPGSLATDRQTLHEWFD